jgi:hypothetical protein
MPYSSSQSEIKLFYKIYAGNSQKPQDAVLLHTEIESKFTQDVIDDLVVCDFWDENFEWKLKNKQLYFKIFRDDEDAISDDMILLENVRMLPNHGLLSLESPLQYAISNSLSWFSGFIPESVKQIAYEASNQAIQWVGDHLTQLPASYSAPTIQDAVHDELFWEAMLDEELMKISNDSKENNLQTEINFKQNLEELQSMVGAQPLVLPEKYCEKLSNLKINLNQCQHKIIDEVLNDFITKVQASSLQTTLLQEKAAKENLDTTTTSTPTSYFDAILSTVWNAASYAINNPLQTLLLGLAVQATASTLLSNTKSSRNLVRYQNTKSDNYEEKISPQLQARIVMPYSFSLLSTALAKTTLICGASHIINHNPYASTPILFANLALLFSPVSAQPWSAAYPATYNLANLEAQSVMELLGVSPGDQTGSSVSAVGDVNGDGKPDFLIGAPQYGQTSGTGSVYLVYGGSWLSSPTFSLSSLNGTTGVKFLGVSMDDETGYSVSSAGDVNGDGRPDFLIGALGVWNVVEGSRGAVYLVYGGPWLNTPTFSLSNLNGVTGVKIVGLPNVGTGTSVSYAGDVNGDGRSDILIGAPPCAYLVYAGSWLNNPTFPLSSLNGTNGVQFTNSYYITGKSVSFAGDINGDGKSDFLISSPYTNNPTPGNVYLVYGGAWLNTPTFFLDNLNGTNGIKFVGESAGAGSALSKAGDVNGDGAQDFLIGDPYTGDGAVYLVYGGPWLNTPVLSLSSLNGTTGVKFWYDGLDTGFSVSYAGDVNGDGRPDFLIGSPPSSAAYLIFGGAWLNTTAFSLANLDGTTGIQFLGSRRDASAGYSVSSAGDLNGNGRQNFLIGAIYAIQTESQFYTGAAYLIDIGDSRFALTTNQLSISRASTAILNAEMLNTTGAVSSANLIMTVSAVQDGYFEAITNIGQAITTFTQQQINQGQIQFVHDGTGFAPSYAISVSASAGLATVSPVVAQITFIQNPPVLLSNSLTLSRMQTISLSPFQLNTTDILFNTSNIVFTLNNIQHGYFQITTQFGQTATSFTQLQVNQGQIQFVHDGSAFAPSYSVVVADPGMAIPAATAQITFTQNPPVLLNNQLLMTQGQSIVFSQTQINSVSVVYSDPTNLVMAINNLQGGHFEIVTQPGQVITTFTQQQINQEQVRFIQDGSCYAPTYAVTLSDTGMTISPSSAQVSLTLFARTVVNNTMAINQGQPVVLGSSQLSAIGFNDMDTQNLRFLITNPRHIAFTRLVFFQKELALAEVVGTHDGSLIPPSYDVSLLNCGQTFGPWQAKIIFNPTVNPAVSNPTLNPTVDDTIKNSIIGSAVSGGLGLAFFVLKFYLDHIGKVRLKKAMEGNGLVSTKQAEFRREVISPIADRIFAVVKNTGVFSSSSEERMNEYVDSIIYLVTILQKTNIDTALETMEPLKQANFLSSLARQTKNQVAPDVPCCSTANFTRFFVAHASPQDIRDKSQSIAMAVKKELQDLEKGYEPDTQPSSDAPEGSMDRPLLGIV